MAKATSGARASGTATNGRASASRASTNGASAGPDRSARDRTYDAIVIGGGHNGLVNGAYLAKAGLKTLILERRHLV
ncbi:MAG TPA: NAD(P)-binding protein, partial [Candidatus Limnocylindrales bacterium]|nr:NAD(P)-binding protein [Candidatus Limnocylindrales bacterium]